MSSKGALEAVLKKIIDIVEETDCEIFVLLSNVKQFLYDWKTWSKNFTYSFFILLNYT